MKWLHPEIIKTFIGLCLVSVLWFLMFRQCSNKTETIGASIANSSTIAIKQNKEIEVLNYRIESLEKRLDSLQNLINKTDSLRNENFRTTPNKSIRTSYSDVTKRYAK